MKTRFLNPKVEAEVTADATLWLAWRLTHGDYDDEIEPLHQEAWVRERSDLEAQQLAALKQRIADIRAERRGVPVERARQMAVEAHGEQRYGDRPYSVHLDAVAEICRPYGPDAQVLAYLHDALEDTDLRPQAIEEAFGPFILRCCQLVTDPPGQNRRERKLRLYEQLSAIHPSSAFELALVIKAADRVANVQACLSNNSALLKMYRQENPAFVQAVSRPANRELIDWLTKLLEN